MLHSLRLRSLKLITNNPEKIRQLTQHRLVVAGRIPHVIQPNQYNRFYLETKAKRSGHYIDFGGAARLAEQSDPVQVEGMAEPGPTGG
jgi:GTP cyclohydrolase II